MSNHKLQYSRTKNANIVGGLIFFFLVRKTGFNPELFLIHEFVWAMKCPCNQHTMPPELLQEEFGRF